MIAHRCMMRSSVTSQNDDQYWNNVVLAMPMEGENNSTIFTDISNSSHTVTAFGNAHISTGQSKFGTSSVYFDGNGDYLQIPNSTDFSFGSGNFAIDMWVKLPAGFSYFYGTLISQWIDSDTYFNIDISDSGFGLGVYYASNYFFGAGINYTHTSDWLHIAFVRDGQTFIFFINGTSAWTITKTASWPSINAPVWIGRGGDYHFNGYIDDLRITKGVARYTTNFTPPTTSFSV